MKKIFKWLGKKIEQSTYETQKIVSERDYQSGLVSVSPRHEIGTNSLNFKIYKASGGTVLETGSYDKKTDRHNSSLYVITDDKDLGKEIGKIITLESLKNWL